MSLKEVYGKCWPVWRITESHDGGAGKGLQGSGYFLLILQMGSLRPRGRDPDSVPQQVNRRAGMPIQVSSQAARLQPWTVSPGSSRGAVTLRQAAVFQENQKRLGLCLAQSLARQHSRLSLDIIVIHAVSPPSWFWGDTPPQAQALDLT